MADFVVVIATAAMLASPAPLGSAVSVQPTPGASAVPLNAPTAGFRTYPDAASCEQAAAALVPPPNARLVCVPAEPMAGEMANAY